MHFNAVRRMQFLEVTRTYEWTAGMYFSLEVTFKEKCVLGRPENRKTRCLCDGKSLMDGFRKITAVSTISICMGKQNGAQRGVI